MLSTVGSCGCSMAVKSRTGMVEMKKIASYTPCCTRCVIAYRHSRNLRSVFFNRDDSLLKVHLSAPLWSTCLVTSSHICPGPNFGYRKRSIKLVSVFFCAVSADELNGPGERVCKGLDDREAFDSLRAPFCGNFLAGHAPNLFRIRFEECAVQTIAKPID